MVMKESIYYRSVIENNIMVTAFWSEAALPL